MPAKKKPVAPEVLTQTGLDEWQHSGADRVLFRFGGCEVEVSVTESGDRLRLYAKGGLTLAVRPRAANVVEVQVDRE